MNRDDVLRAIENARAAGDADSVQRLSALLDQQPTDDAQAAPSAPASDDAPETPPVDPSAVVVRGATPILPDGPPPDEDNQQGTASGASGFDRATMVKALENAHASGDENSAERIAGMISEHDASQEGQSVTEDQLRRDPDWIGSAKVLWQLNNGDDAADAPKTDEDYANYALDEMGWFNSNLPQMGLKAASLWNATDEQRRAFMYLMDRSENLSWSWEGVGRMARGAVTDPSNYVGIGSLGFGEAGVQAAKFATRDGIKQMLKAGVNMGVRAAADGAMYGVARDVGSQTVHQLGGGQTGFDYGEAAQQAGVGAALGFATGSVLGATVRGFQMTKAARAAEKTFERIEPDTTTIKTAAPSVPSIVGKGANRNIASTVARDAEGVPHIEIHASEHALAPTEGSIRTDHELPDGTVPANDRPANSNRVGIVGEQKGIQNYLDDITQAVQDIAKDGPIGVQAGRQSLSVLDQAAKAISDVIVEASRSGDGGGLVEALSKAGITAAQLQLLRHGAQQANDVLLKSIVELTKDARATASKAQAVAIREYVDQLEATRGAVMNLDLELSTQAGRDLRMRQEGLNTGDLRGVTIQSLMDDEGMSRKQAEARLLQLVRQRSSYASNKPQIDKLNKQIEQALSDGRYTDRQQLIRQRDTLLGKSDGQDLNGAPSGKLYRIFDRAIKGVLETTISNVFSTSTLIVNTIPSYFKILTHPFMHYVVSGVMKPYAFRRMLAEYEVLRTYWGTSLKAAGLAFKYEQDVLMHEPSRAFFTNGVLPKTAGALGVPRKFGGWLPLGGAVRFLPRVLMAQDAFMETMAYRAWAHSTATVNALEEATDKGLTGQAKDNFIKQAVKDATDRLYSSSPETDNNVIDMLTREAQARGLGGQRADNWVRDQLNRNKGLLRSATSQAGKDYVKDLLFKREFSGGKGDASKVRGWASDLAVSYEKFVQRNPLMRVAGQLFFRTPVRVFEEGLRITPGLNLITPGFIADLSGKNGVQRQLRAQGEAMVSYAVGAATLSMYASGSITGGGPWDYREERLGENTPDWQPYSIRLPDGSWWSYRNLDPIATPLKIIVNALDRLSVLEYRRKQGEMVNQSLVDQATAYMNVGVGAVGQAIRDANLTQGLDNVAGFFSSLGDDKAGGNTPDKFLKAVGHFVANGVPATISKSRLTFGGPAYIDDPLTIEQILRARINPQDSLVPRQYTPYGAPRINPNPGAGLFVFSPMSQQDRERGASAEQQAVDRELWMVGQAADTDFTAPYKSDLMPSVDDLRKVNTKDGKETLYDRWQRYVLQAGAMDALYKHVVGSNIPFGAPGNSPRAQAINDILNAYRDKAMHRLITEEVGSFDDYQAFQRQQAQQSRTNQLNLPFHNMGR